MMTKGQTQQCIEQMTHLLWKQMCCDQPELAHPDDEVKSQGLAESQNMLSWRGLTRISKSNS